MVNSIENLRVGGPIPPAVPYSYLLFKPTKRWVKKASFYGASALAKK